MAKRKNTPSTLGHIWQETRSIIAGIICLFVGILFVFSSSESQIGKAIEPHAIALMGPYFRWIGGMFFLALGTLLAVKKLQWNSARLLGILLFLVSATSLIEYASNRPGTILNFSEEIVDLFGKVPALTLIFWVFLLSIWLSLRISYRHVIDAVQKRLPSMKTVGEEALSVGKTLAREVRPEPFKKRQDELDAEIKKLEKAPTVFKNPLLVNKAGEIQTPLVKHISISPKGKDAVIEPTHEEEKHDWSHFKLPTIDLLKVIDHPNQVDEAEVKKRSLQIEKALLQFNIEVEMREAKIGPTVTQYRLKPADGVKLSRIENLKKDLALALHAKSIRIQAPIPGVGLVGIEVPNTVRDSVGIREMLESANFSRAKAPLSFAVGKDINGEYIVGDLTKMPHLLVAGQTASGKSVGVNGMLVSLLYRHTPQTLRMILIDPKQVEFELYDGIPHLLTPVISDPGKALNALKWAVGEMQRRYSELKSYKVKNLEEYNTKVDIGDRMYYIVIVIDELADLMMSGNKKEVEHAITRLAQMARAVGMHLIVATQRPSVDVITGLIKANMPSRIAFSLPTVVDSRTILDRMGAEDLLGYGDLLYSPVGLAEPERIQWAYMTTEEAEKVVNFLKKQVEHLPPDALYDFSISEGEKSEAAGNGKSEFGNYEEDPAIIEEAIQVVREAGKASTTMLQRRMQLGYARAARVIEILESLGVVGPQEGSKPRSVR